MLVFIRDYIYIEFCKNSYLYVMEVTKMFDMHNSKNKRVVSIVIIVLLVLAMIVPSIAAFIQ